MNETELRQAMSDYGEAVYRLALCRLQNTADAEDVYQDVFLRLLEQRGAETWEAERRKAWLLRTAVNRCADLGRRRGRVLPLENISNAPAPAGSETAELWDAVSRLPEDLRTAVHLFYGEGYESGEIGTLLGVPGATVRSRLRRARNKLRTILTGGMEDDKPLPEFTEHDSRTCRTQ